MFNVTFQKVSCIEFDSVIMNVIFGSRLELVCEVFALI